ncbi:hypothetical protein BH10ACI4_BH10ACI4_37880 [soil metagenome]
MTAMSFINNAVIVWEGDSLDILRSFPEDIRGEFGQALRAMQEGGTSHLRYATDAICWSWRL